MLGTLDSRPYRPYYPRVEFSTELKFKKVKFPSEGSSRRLMDDDNSYNTVLKLCSPVFSPDKNGSHFPGSRLQSHWFPFWYTF